jgi:hypothetical protein
MNHLFMNARLQSSESNGFTGLASTKESIDLSAARVALVLEFVTRQ